MSRSVAEEDAGGAGKDSGADAEQPKRRLLKILSGEIKKSGTGTQ